MIKLKKKLKENGLDTEIWMYDHCFIGWPRIVWTLNEYPELADCVDSVALHYYEGGVELVAQVAASEYGVMLVVYGFLAGVFMTTIPMIVGYFMAKYVFKLPLLNNLGSITGGMTSTPALGTLVGVSGTDNVASAYASTYPVALVLIVLASNLIGTFLG